MYECNESCAMQCMHVFYHTCNICMYESSESCPIQCMHVFYHTM